MRGWVLSVCDCEDGFTSICLECELVCDHDVLCGKCRGTGLRPEKATLLDRLGGAETYKTKAEAIKDSIE